MPHQIQRLAQVIYLLPLNGTFHITIHIKHGTTPMSTRTLNESALTATHYHATETEPDRRRAGRRAGRLIYTRTAVFACNT